MLKKLLAIAFIAGLISGALNAAPAHVESRKARLDNTGRHFSQVPGLQEHIGRNGVPTHYPQKGSELHLRNR
jgi:hypothetical protein